MADYRIPAADGKTVTLSIGCPDDEVNRVLRNLKRYHGLEPENVLAEVLGNFTSANLLFDIEPDQIFNMLLAFWTGYEMAAKTTSQVG